MDLRAIAEHWVNESLEAFDEATGTFVPDAMIARISLTDRFLSNFNRPLRRRMLHYAPGTVLPASLTIRHPQTLDVYIIGQHRGDSDANVHYHDMVVAHLVTDEGPDSSSGLAQVHRSAPVGPADDPGWLVDSVVAQHYADLELRTSLNEPDIQHYRIESFFLFMPLHAQLQKYDFIELHGIMYRVTDIYSDSGFKMGRIDREPDYRIDVVLKVDEQRVYDPVQVRWTTQPRNYAVTMTLESHHDHGGWVTEAEDYILLSVEEDHIGVTPKPGMVIVYEGRERTIRHVHYYRGERQYKLRVR